MIFIYTLFTRLVATILPLIGLFIPKIKLFVTGRKHIFKRLKQDFSTDKPVLWFHTASLGEYEQGLPIIEACKKKYPNHVILVTFFSPSGYEVKKENSIADFVYYLPLDTKKNATQFLDIVQPKLAVFVKYEFWPNYLQTLKKRNIPTLAISAIFRKEQIFFKPYGVFMKDILSGISHFFVQNQESITLLKSIGITNASISGDTRFDRVLRILDQDNQLDFITDFKQDALCFVAGSTWPQGNAVLTSYINKTKHKQVKFIIAPHTIEPKKIKALENQIQKKCVLYSEKEAADLKNAQVLILDTIGLLTKVYASADIAYVGGGIGKTGLHNTLEPAVFGIPILIGARYKGFQEAEILVAKKGIISCKTTTILEQYIEKCITDTDFREQTGAINKAFTIENKGATQKIMGFIDKNIL